MVARTTSLDGLAERLAKDYPYSHEPFGLKGIIKLVLWVILRSREYTTIKEPE